MIKILKQLKRTEWIMAAVSIVFIVIGVWLDLTLPEFMSEITTLVQTEGSLMSDIWFNGVMMLLCALGSLATAIVVGFFAARIGAVVSLRLRSAIYKKVDQFSMEEINLFSTASLVTRSTNDVTQVQMLIAMGLQLLVRAPIMGIWAIIKISNKGMEWTIATGVAVLVMLLLIGFVFLFVIPKFKKMQKLTDNINRVTRENLTGLQVVRAYNAEGFQEEKFEDANKELTDTQMFTTKAMAIMQPSMSLIMGGLSVAIYWIGAVLISNAGAIERLSLFANMVVFSSYSMQVIMSFMMIAMLFVFLPRASVAAKRINEVLETKPSITDGTLTSSNNDLKGVIEFRNVGFKYPKAADYVVKNINFKVNQGETIAFIGSTGSGKSTLVNLVLRFYDATEGEVLVDGVNVKDYKLDTLYQKLGYVPQKAVMFSKSVIDNVAFGTKGGEKSTLDDVKKAVEIAQGTDFVSNLENGYEGKIARGGANVSGGQKQRLSIARAICRNPEIYIFDDSFSALDYKTDRQLRTALKKETKGVTSLIVAQRIGTILDANKIVVLDNGVIVGIGTHKELLKSCSVYQEIAYSQLSQEELAA